jgi:hypothetical protein
MLCSAMTTLRFVFSQKDAPSGAPTLSAHPGTRSNCDASYYVRCSRLASRLRLRAVCTSARFSPDDKYSRERVILKKRFGILLTQTPHKEL